MPRKIHDRDLRLLADQLDQLEDRLGAGTGPAVDPPGAAILALTKVVRSLIDLVDGVDLRTHENYESILAIEEAWNAPSRGGGGL